MLLWHNGCQVHSKRQCSCLWSETYRQQGRCPFASCKGNDTLQSTPPVSPCTHSCHNPTSEDGTKQAMIEETWMGESCYKIAPATLRRASFLGGRVSLLRQGGWTRWPTEVPSNPYHSVILWFATNADSAEYQLTACFAFQWRVTPLNVYRYTVVSTLENFGLF